jgi:hypothetical protein
MSSQDMKTAELQQLQPLSPKAKYEMNLAEFPIAILSKHLPKALKSIEYEDTITGKDGKEVPRKWKVSPSSEYGFGSSEIIRTLFELFQIWKESEFKTRSIPFQSVYNLVRRLGLQDAAPNYERIRRDLNALVGILIEAKNAFWDNEKKAYVDKTFHLFESMSSYHEGPEGQQPLPLASIEASKELWGSIQANALITACVSREWFHSLSPGEQRLSLYLSKMLHGQPIHKREVTKLGEQLPLLAKTYKKVKQQLGVLSQGLVDKDHPLLASFHYEEKRRGESDVIVFLRKKTKKKDNESSEAQGSRIQRREDLGQPDATTEQPLELARYFQKTFFGIENGTPSSREIAQAAGLIQKHGLEKAKYVVEFCHKVVPETNFKPQVFGAVIRYTDRAIADYNKRKEAEERREKERARERARKEREQEAWRRGEELLAQLTPEERERRFHEAREEVLAGTDWLRKNPDGPIVEKLVRASVIKKLTGESPDTNPGVS